MRILKKFPHSLAYIKKLLYLCINKNNQHYDKERELKESLEDYAFMNWALNGNKDKFDAIGYMMFDIDCTIESNIVEVRDLSIEEIKSLANIKDESEIEGLMKKYGVSYKEFEDLYKMAEEDKKFRESIGI